MGEWGRREREGKKGKKVERSKAFERPAAAERRPQRDGEEIAFPSRLYPTLCALPSPLDSFPALSSLFKGRLERKRRSGSGGSRRGQRASREKGERRRRKKKGKRGHLRERGGKKKERRRCRSDLICSKPPCTLCPPFPTPNYDSESPMRVLETGRAQFRRAERPQTTRREKKEKQKPLKRTSRIRESSSASGLSKSSTVVLSARSVTGPNLATRSWSHIFPPLGPLLSEAAGASGGPGAEALAASVWR